MPADLKELRRLHEAYVTAKSQLQPGSIVGHFRADKALAYLNIAARNALPELLDRIEELEKIAACPVCGRPTGGCCTVKDWKGTRISELEAENARLRKALERIVFLHDSKIAREALGR